MKLLARKKVTPVKTAPVSQGHGKSHKNKLPSDEYKDLLPPIDIILDEKSKIVVSVKRGGELGLPKVDIRLFIDTPVYTGFTQKGVNFNLNKLLELNDVLNEVRGSCEKLKLFEEFEEEDSEEESESEEE